MNIIETITQVLSELNPIQVKVEATPDKVTVTILSNYFQGLSVKSRNKEVLNILQYKNKHLFPNVNFEIKAYTPEEKK